MVEPLFKDSLKVHFAGMEDMPKAACMNAVGCAILPVHMLSFCPGQDERKQIPKAVLHTPPARRVWEACDHGLRPLHPHVRGGKR